MYCCADVHFMVFYLLALRDAFSKVQVNNPAYVFSIMIDRKSVGNC